MIISGIVGGQKGVSKAKRGWGGEPTSQVAVRLSESLLSRLDRHVERLRDQTPEWVIVTRADAVRALLMQALERAESEDAGRDGYRTKWQE